MVRLAKGFRLTSGLFLLLNLVAFFLPITCRYQKNYPGLAWSQFDYLKAAFDQVLPSGSEAAKELSASQNIFLLACIVLPMILVLVGGIYNVIGNPRQRLGGILAMVTCLLYVIFVWKIDLLWTAASDVTKEAVLASQSFERGIGCLFVMIFSGMSVLFSIIGWVVTPKVKKKEPETLHKMQEWESQMKQAQVRTQEQKQVQMQEQVQKQREEVPGIPAYVPGTPRGVLKGLVGIYAEVEIPFADGEPITLGRAPDNNLVFEKQEKVSRNHCRITWNGQKRKFLFEDFSSNGSFVIGKADCLPQNISVWLKPGTEFALGDERNIFRLE